MRNKIIDIDGCVRTIGFKVQVIDLPWSEIRKGIVISQGEAKDDHQEIVLTWHDADQIICSLKDAMSHIENAS